MTKENTFFQISICSNFLIVLTIAIVQHVSNIVIAYVRFIWRYVALHCVKIALNSVRFAKQTRFN